MEKKFFQFILYCSLPLFLTNCGNGDKGLETGFIQPYEKVQTSIYWYWISGNISVDGIKKDLYAMKEAGINRAYIGNIGIPEVKTPYKNVKFESDEWWEVLHAALKTATELGIEIGIFNSPGWSQSGGPWVKPEQAMRYLTSVKQEVEGGKQLSIELKHPNKNFQDVKVIAYPSPQTEKRSLSAGTTRIQSKPSLPVLSNLIDGDMNSEIRFPEIPDRTVQLEFINNKPFTLRGFKLYPSPNPINAQAVLEVKTGNNYTQLSTFDINRTNANPNVGFDPYAPIAITIPTTEGSQFRLTLTNIQPGNGIKEIELSSLPVVERYPEKTLAKMYQSPLPYWHEYQWKAQPELDNASLAVPSDKVIDLTSHLKGDVIEWNAPAGIWTVIRTGMLPTGVTNAPANPEATGLETDKMSRKHIKSHFDAYMGEIIKRIPAEDRKCWKVVVQDSYETGGQNFTDDFIEDFKKRFGYDPVPFLPVYDGIVVENRDRSDRFLWDVRRMIADKVAYDYVGGLRDAAHEYGLKTWLECYGHWGFPGEFLQYGGQSDEIGGEFWSFGDLGNIENRAASSCGHIYGKQKISAESFTSGGRPFNCYPAMMKQRGDRFFTEGINNTLLHLYIAQPTEEHVPGVNAWFSSEFNRLNTWYSHLDLFTTYLKRTNFMLQQGLNIADVAYFIGEDAPKMTGITDPELPKGYQFDYINAEVIERDMTVVDGLLTLPHGTQYKILVLPKLKTMRPELLQKIKSLIEQGAVVLGPAPERSPSGQNYGKADEEVKALAAELWNNLDETSKKSRKMGKGELLYGMNMKEALDHIGCRPDCETPADAPILYGHRSSNNAEIYFVSNQSEKTIQVSPEFRVNGMQPELWNAIDGSIRTLPCFQQTDHQTTIVPMKLYPLESAFIVFRHKAGKAESESIDANYPAPKTIAELNQPWKVTFKDKLRGPKEPQTFNTLEDISQNGDKTIRYYSGTIVYENDFICDQKSKGQLYLDLNQVGVMAKVKINGQYAGGVWTAPYRINVTPFIEKGKNHVEIEVVTTWQNRLIGDSGLPEAERTTWAPCNNWQPTEALQPSGLMGPVRLQQIDFK